MHRLFRIARFVLIEHRVLTYALTGVSAVGLHLALTWFFTEFVFGLERYMLGYAIGITVTLIYNFTLHAYVNFRNTSEPISRFSLFVVYSLLMTAFQAYLVRTITPIVGLEHYLIVIATIILVFSTVSFLVLKFILFKHKQG
jgi:putative flippase GtrA